MAVCGFGHSNVEAARFCTTCGRALPLPADEAGRSLGSRSGLLLGGTAVLVAAGLLVGAVVAVSGRDDRDRSGARALAPSPLRSGGASDGLVVLSTGRTGAGPLYLVPDGEPLGGAEAFGGGEVIPIGRLPRRLQPASADAVPGPGLVPISGGAVVAWNSGGTVNVGAVRTGDPHPTLLYQGGADTGVGLASEAGDRPVIQIEDGGTCLETDGVRPAEVVVEAPGTCRFQLDGRILASGPVGDEGQAFRLHDADGTLVSTIEPTGESAQVHGAVVVVERDGSTAIAEARTGRQLDERGTTVLDALGSARDGAGLLLRSATYDESAEVERVLRVDGAGAVAPVVEGIDVTARIAPDGTVITGEADWTTGVVRAVDPVSGEVVDLASGPGLDFELLGGDDGRVLAWDRRGTVWLGPITAPLPAVGTVRGLTGMRSISTSAAGPGVLALASGVTDDEDRGRPVWIDDAGIHDLPGAWSLASLEDAGPDGALVLLTDFAAPSDEKVLFHVDGDHVTELDRGAIAFARFDGDRANYQWRHSGAPSRDTAIRSIALEPGAEPEVIQREAQFALPPAGATVWAVDSGDAPWSRVTGCGATRSISVLSSTHPTLDRPVTVCVEGQGRPGEMGVWLSSRMPFHAVIEDRTGVLATADGPMDDSVPVRSDGSPVTIRITPGPGEAHEVSVGASFHADP